MVSCSCGNPSILVVNAHHGYSSACGRWRCLPSTDHFDSHTFAWPQNSHPNKLWMNYVGQKEEPCQNAYVYACRGSYCSLWIWVSIQILNYPGFAFSFTDGETNPRGREGVHGLETEPSRLCIVSFVLSLTSSRLSMYVLNEIVYISQIFCRLSFISSCFKRIYLCNICFLPIIYIVLVSQLHMYRILPEVCCSWCLLRENTVKKIVASLCNSYELCSLVNQFSGHVIRYWTGADQDEQYRYWPWAWEIMLILDSREWWYLNWLRWSSRTDLPLCIQFQSFGEPNIEGLRI